MKEQHCCFTGGMEREREEGEGGGRRERERGEGREGEEERGEGEEVPQNFNNTQSPLLSFYLLLSTS